VFFGDPLIYLCEDCLGEGVLVLEAFGKEPSGSELVARVRDRLAESN
jgi:hypothetical protein